MCLLEATLPGPFCLAAVPHQSGSDADVQVLLSVSPGKFVSTTLAMDDLAYEVLLETGIRIQSLPVWQSEWEHSKRYSNPHLLKNIAREGIWLSGNRDFFTGYPPII
jgi:hypothetical protein